MKAILSTFSPETTLSSPAAVHGLANLQQAYPAITLSKGQTLFQEGGLPHNLYYLRRGIAKLHQYGSDGKEQIVRLVGVGEFIGYAELLNSIHYHVSATVLEKATVAVIPQSDFLTTFASDPSVNQYFTRLLCRDLVEANRRLVALAYQPVRGRLANTLLALDDLFERKNPDEESIITLSRQDLANLVGTAKETVIRLLSEFKSQEWITTHGQSIAVLNPQSLKRIGRICYD